MALSLKGSISPLLDTKYEPAPPPNGMGDAGEEHHKLSVPLLRSLHHPFLPRLYVSCLHRCIYARSTGSSDSHTRGTLAHSSSSSTSPSSSRRRSQIGLRSGRSLPSSTSPLFCILCVEAPSLPPITATTLSTSSASGSPEWGTFFHFFLSRQHLRGSLLRVRLCCSGGGGGQARDVGGYVSRLPRVPPRVHFTAHAQNKLLIIGPPYTHAHTRISLAFSASSPPPAPPPPSRNRQHHPNPKP